MILGHVFRGIAEIARQIQAAVGGQADATRPLRKTVAKTGLLQL